MSSFNIGPRLVGRNHTPLVVAEIGINHGGCLETAKHMVLSARLSGCEIVKHQTHFLDDEMTDDAKRVKPDNANESIWDVIEKAALGKDQEIALKKYAESIGLIYISTPFSRSAADFLAELDVPAFKIGSGECDNLPLVRHICSFSKPVIMSTGMHSIQGVKASVEAVRNANVPFALLQCTNEYPSPPGSVSLRGITDLASEFPDAIVGFSDHSIGPAMAIAAAALGACIIERHYTDSRYRRGPDIVCSMDPTELRYLIDATAEIHCALRNEKGPTIGEKNVYLFARGSVVADKDINEGEVIDDSMVWVRRPGTGQIPADAFYKVIGRTAKRNLKRNTQLSWSDFK